MLAEFQQLHYEESAKEWEKYLAEEISAVRKAIPAARKKSLVHIAKHLGEIETKLRGCKNITGKWMVHQKKRTEASAKMYLQVVEMSMAKYDMTPAMMPGFLRVEQCKEEAYKQDPPTNLYNIRDGGDMFPNLYK